MACAWRLDIIPEKELVSKGSNNWKVTGIDLGKALNFKWGIHSKQ